MNRFDSWRLVCLIAILAGVFAVDRSALAQERASDAGQPPRQVVSERSPIRTDTTFAYRFRKVTSTLSWDGGEDTLVVTQLPAGEREHKTISALRPGELLLLERSPAWKLITSAPLEFGAITLPVGNVAPGYPGTYAVWLRRTAGGWEAVFNDEADAWGTQHDPAHDRVAVPLAYELRPGEARALTGVLEGDPSAAFLRLTWGERRWSAPFRVTLDAAASLDPAGARDTTATRATVARTSATRTDWPHHGADLGASRYAPLDRIDASNVASLVVTWRWTSPDEAIRARAMADTPAGAEPLDLSSRRHEAIPLAIGGRLFTVTSLSQLAAIDAATGETLWVFDPGSWRAGPPTNLGFVHRGCAYWRDPTTGEERLLYATTDSWLHAVDARTGRAVESFGDIPAARLRALRLPISYVEEGHQFVVVATARRGGPQELIALALSAEGTD